MARHRSFDRLARGIVASVLGVLGGGCDTDDGLQFVAFTGGNCDKDGLDLEGMEPLSCKEGAFDALGDVTPSVEYDSLELIAAYGRDVDAPTVVASRGTRCGGAEDAPACMATFDAYMDESGSLKPPMMFPLGPCPDGCTGYYLLATRGDEVIAIGSEEVVAMLAPIDTATEAAWIAGLGEYDLDCSSATSTGVRATPDGWEVTASHYANTCPVEVTQDLLSVSAEGRLGVLDCEVVRGERGEGGCIGRRPACAWRLPQSADATLGARLAGLAQLEAESVPAFAELARELCFHGAPRSLVRRAHRARRDEVRHARVMTHLARRHGGRPARSSVARAAPRQLVEVAILNAQEGCVREAYGAVVGRWQSARAADPAIRAAMLRIARDEATHAALSLAIDAWARRHLTPAERARVEQARAAALATLRAEIANANEAADPTVAASLGLPSPAEATLLLDALTRALA